MCRLVLLWVSPSCIRHIHPPAVARAAYVADTGIADTLPIGRLRL